jgi:hypothetical protein
MADKHILSMNDVFEQIRQQIHEIRNIVTPVDLKFAFLEGKIDDYKSSLEEAGRALESKLLANIHRLDNQDIKIADIVGALERLAQRVRQLEQHRPH